MGNKKAIKLQEEFIQIFNRAAISFVFHPGHASGDDRQIDLDRETRPSAQ